MSAVFRTLVVTADAVAMARALSSCIPSGIGMFVAGYSPTGAEPATHFVSEGRIGEEFAAGLESPEALVAMIAAAGQALPLAQAELLLSRAVVSDRSAQEVLAEMGLTAVVPESV
jgi:hypothetical protein